MRFASVTVGLLVLVLLMMVPVEGTPSLQSDSQAVYKLSASVTFPIPTCEVSPITDPLAMTVCPMIADVPPTIAINGTLTWAVTSLNSTTVGLNVTKNLSISSDDTTTVPTFHIARSFNESIDLATRLSTILPMIMPEVEDSLAQAQSNLAIGVPSGVSLASSMSLVEPILHPRLYTMWWVNGPLKVNDSVPVLFLHTNVTGPTTVDLGGSLGQRDAWTLFYSFPGISPLAQPETVGASIAPIDERLGANFTFNYDQKGDALLSATANIHFGFIMRTPYQPPCADVCPASSRPTIVTRSFGFSVHVSLILASTNLDLDQQMGSTGSTGGSGSGSGSGSGPGPGQGANPSSGSGSGPNSNKTPQSISAAPQPVAFPWVYWLLAIVAVAVIASGIWIARRRNRKTAPQTTSPTT